eukprot:TRINITY_DN3304_c0_g1_i2.p1 TRINITY_DN3304_c0_g1~~TRINITY_DN3304_c0_g1_i2.p1  ORF type:complete len:162 (+),score=21.73 TRINITY_DN3304_c0_g1_i2:69-488(+)
MEAADTLFKRLKTFETDIDFESLSRQEENLGDFRVKLGNLENAGESYFGAIDFLAVQRDYIMKIVHLMASNDVALTPREQKIISRLKDQPTKKSRGRTKKPSATSEFPFIPLELEEVERTLPIRRDPNRISAKQGIPSL